MRILGFDIDIKKRRDTEQENREFAESLRKMGLVFVSPFEVDKPLSYPEDYNVLIDSYKSWIYVCVSKNAAAVAAAPLRLYVGKKDKNTKLLVKTKDIEPLRLKAILKQANLIPYHRKAVELREVTEHPFLEVLKTVNPFINRFDLWEGTESWMEVTGNAYWYLYKDKLGVPVEIWPLPPQNMRIIPSQEKLIAGYMYKKGTLEIPFEVEEIVHFKFASLTGSLYGQGPLSAVIETYTLDKNIRTFENSLMKNMGRPEGVLQAKEGISEADFERIKVRWKSQHGGVNKVGKTVILENGLEYKPITFTPREMNYVVGRKMNREEIAAAFGVPMSKLTTEDVNRSNATSGNWQYQSDTIEPRLRRIEETINAKVMPMYDENLFVAYDSTLPEDRTFEQSEMTSNLASYVTTINEEREKKGLPKVEWGDIPLAPATIAPLGSIQPGQGAAPAGSPPAPSLEENEEITEPEKMQLIERVTKRVIEKLRKKKNG